MALNFPSNPSNGDTFESYVYDSTIGGWVVNQQQAIARFIASETAPTSPSPGDAWFCTLDATTYIYYDNQWIEASNSGTNGQSRFISSDTKPVDVENGDAWFNTNTGQIFIYYVDGDTSQWIEAGAPVLGFDTLSNLSDVDLTSAQNGQVLMYDSGYSVWVPADIYVGPQPAKTITSDNIEIDFSDGIELEQRAVTGDVTFTGSNYTSGVKKTIYLEGDTVSRNLTFPIGWNFITDKPTAIGASKKNILDLNSFGTSESTTVALWLGAGSFGPTIATGGTVSEILLDGVIYKVHSFGTGQSLFTVESVGDIDSIEYLVVAGGGGGGSRYMGGGGGAGGLRTNLVGSTSGRNSTPESPKIITTGTYSVVVGAGGSGDSGASVADAQGKNSSFDDIVALGGGAGGREQTGPWQGQAGGSGGGDTGYGSRIGLGTSAQGFDGGTGATYGAGGGGGAGSSGSNGNANDGGNGGAGLANSITGISLFYAGGGGGGDYAGSGASLGGSGVGGNGGPGPNNSSGGNPTSGLNGRGGGGGGANGYNDTTAGINGGDGGSGIVIVRYPITDPN